MPERLNRHRGGGILGTKLTKSLALILVSLFLFITFFSFLRPGQGVFSKNGRINLVYEDPISIASWDANNRELTVLVFPEKSKLSLPFGMGNYPVGGVAKLSRQENSGLHLLAHAVMITTGVGIDGWVGKNESEIMGYDIGTDSTKRASISQRLSIFTNRDNNLNWIDRWKLFWLSNGLSKHQIKIVNLEDTNTISLDPDPDGVAMAQVDRQKVLAYQSKNFRNSEILKENLSVSVLNTTSFDGLAGSVSQLLRVNGVEVISEGSRVDSGSFLCELRGEQQTLHSYTAKKIISWLGCRSVVEETLARSDLTVVLGEQFGEYLRGK
jgi:hypothetical protein